MKGDSSIILIPPRKWKKSLACFSYQTHNTFQSFSVCAGSSSAGNVAVELPRLGDALVKQMADFHLFLFSYYACMQD